MLGAAGEAGHVGRELRGDQPDRRTGERRGWRVVQTRIGAQDRLLQTAQLRAGLEPQLGDQEAAGVLVGRQRLGLPPGTVQGEHELGMEPLPQRVLAHQPGQLLHQRGVAASGKVGLDALLQQPEPPLLQAPRRLAQHVHLAQVRERRAAPQCQRLPQQLTVWRTRLPRLIGEGLEPLRVQLSLAHQQGVRGAAAFDASLVTQDPAQVVDVDVQVLQGRAGRAGAPEGSDELVVAERDVGSREQHAEQRPLLGRAQGERSEPVTHLQRAQHREVQLARRILGAMA